MYSLVAAAAFVALANAQSYVQSSIITSASSLSTATSTSTGTTTHTVAVAKANHAFSPDVVLAEAGDVIEFQFYPTNHSVIRAAYGYPCVPYEMVLGAGHPGFTSGYMPVDAVLDKPPIWRVKINDTDPIFYYCGAPNSCIGYGMVGVINPNANTSLARQRQLAEASTYALVPGQDWPDEGSIPSGVVISTTSHTSSTSSTVPTATSAPVATPSVAPAASHGLGAGAIAGIAIGGAAVLLGAFVAIWFCGRQSRKHEQPPPAAPAQEVAYGYRSNVGSIYGKPAHMSVVSGYNMPPVYEQHGMQSPNLAPTPVDPAMYHNGGLSPQLRSVSPQQPNSQMPNMYATGTHQIAPVEMQAPLIGSGPTSPRRSIEKQGPGVERYG